MEERKWEVCGSVWERLQGGRREGENLEKKNGAAPKSEEKDKIKNVNEKKWKEGNGEMKGA